MARFAGFLGGPLLMWGVAIFVLGGSSAGIVIGFLIACLLFVVQLVVSGLSAVLGVRGVIGELVIANGLFFAWMYATCQAAGCVNYSAEIQVLWHASITGVICLSYAVRRFLQSRLA
ncbi:MAG: hypothetical protein AAFZ01_01245 [Pseudomonadota bacterium]